MRLNLHWIVYFIMAEFAVVALIVIAMYFVKWLYSLKTKNEIEAKQELYSYIDDLLSKKEDLHPLEFNKDWNSLDLLIPLLHYYDKHSKDPYWKTLRQELLNRIMLPLARSNTFAFDWTERLLAAQTFTLAAVMEDENDILTLLKDPVPLVHLEANLAVKRLPTKQTVNVLIDEMRNDRRRAFGLYLRAFEDMTAETAAIVLERLIGEKDEGKREVCYKILTMYNIPVYYPAAYADVQSSNLELAAAAISLIEHTEKDGAISLLEGLLEDSRFELQVIALKRLAILDIAETIPSILKMIYSKNWWVRINAALALSKMGVKGRDALMSVDESKDKLAYKEAQNVLMRES